MQLGDLVTLSAAGRKLQNNWRQREGAEFGIIVKVYDPARLDNRPLYHIRWFWLKNFSDPYFMNSRPTCHHRYELKRLKKAHNKQEER